MKFGETGTLEAHHASVAKDRVMRLVNESSCFRDDMTRDISSFLRIVQELILATDMAQ
eukprot:CAMPEP_0185790374 /NCGR_PEP_ID=MMETSP1174-20130828/155885_1 /TAXON_ID=35687 /ORGANISM="Dictyocha speculum, Strain CCMP1381" /LENGTH=57 /DNA_ID=CAMNT_0028485023 /DNA_START=85 /DNA_END=255 /DNA_ORIENTATION=+